MGVLPHDLFLVTGGVLSLVQSLEPLFMEKDALGSVNFSEVATGLIVITILMIMIIAWRLGWPVWSASWYGYAVWGLMVMAVLLNK